MFGFIKNLLRKAPETSAENYQDTAFQSVEDAGSQAAKPPVFKAPPLRQNGAPPNGHSKGIELNLQSILQGLPLELQPRIRRNDVGEATITVPLEKVLAQLSRGAVKVSFGELRQAAPDIFTAQNDRDRVLVCLPLADILAKLNPALIARRRVQRQVEVPAEISSPFDSHGQGLAFSVAPAKSEAEAAPVPPRHAASVPPPIVPPPRAALSSIPTPVAPVAMPEPAPAAPAAPAPRFAVPSAATPPVVAPTPATPKAAPKLQVPAQPQHATPARPAGAAAASSAPAAPARSTIAFNPNPTLVKPVSPIDTTVTADSQVVPSQAAAPKSATPISAPKAVAPAPAPKPAMPSVREAVAAPAPAATSVAAKAGPAAEPLIVSLASLAEAWPEEVRKEVISLGLAEAKVGLPANAIEQALKQGRICFSWKTIRSWVKPAIPAVASSHDGAVLDLPLKVVAPLFLERQREAAKDKQKIAVDEDIPNLFFGFPQPEGAAAAAAATARVSDTNYYVWEDSHDTARIHESEVKRPSPGTKFVAKYATPNEVVSRAAGLEGVAGALIALPDGLMVANRLPPDLNADT
ncbi:MAG TPA: hypothetical protein VL793_15300, partial [Patescibacteria group bacterium]|nr:hypothetical protein [Patescibacteria group bacterium]